MPSVTSNRPCGWDTCACRHRLGCTVSGAFSVANTKSFDRTSRTRAPSARVIGSLIVPMNPRRESS